MGAEKLKVWVTIAGNLFTSLPHLLHYKNCQFLSDRQTLEQLKIQNKGIVRFGDGELAYLSGYSFPHQKQDSELRKKLKKILRGYSPDTPYLIGLPYDILFNQYQKRNLPKGV